MMGRHFFRSTSLNTMPAFLPPSCVCVGGGALDVWVGREGHEVCGCEGRGIRCVGVRGGHEMCGWGGRGMRYVGVRGRGMRCVGVRGGALDVWM